MTRPSLAKLASLYCRIGNSTFGSGMTTVVLLSEAVTRRGWLTQPQCDLFYALARVVPGTNVLAFVAATAHAIRSWTGAVAAVIAYTIPASAIVVALTLAYGQWRDHPVGGPAIAAAMSSIVGIIVAAGWLLVVPRLRPGSRIRTGTFVAAALIVSVWLPPLAVLALGGAAGYFWRERQP